MKIPFVKHTRKNPSFTADERGIAAAEFSIIAPVIVALYLGLAELSLVMSVDRQVSHSASVAGDMVAQVEEVDAADMGDIMAATLYVSQVPDTATFVMEITSYEMDASGNIVNLGSAIYNSGNKGMLKAVDPANFGPELLSQSSGVVVANVAYSYNPLGYERQIITSKTEGGKIKQVDKGTRRFLSPTVTLRETFMLKPRRSTSVEIGDGVDSEMTCTGFGSSTTCS
jgi:Flp pilus assembly protein TadG